VVRRGVDGTLSFTTDRVEFIALRYFTSDCSDTALTPREAAIAGLRAGPTRTPLRSIARS
jgi:hypothetical protein